MTTITINNPNNFSLATLKKLLQSLDIEVVKIESEEEIPAEHLESIQKGLEELKEGLGKDSAEIRSKAKEICSR